ncbi:hypothetical protein G0Q06_09490 [Puniceicoccales bacterium CK1056]|uniref:Uncharacterized protein n=1 Tax=Oceanipulchritudo coccoides TaxID=2706888 RepID=A0A6B2M2Z4_9BACT|nr:hypothetical protein [Oceanipulchritudo coccoides]NDV62682.1 hypothetical protein [Oceanipulchritudo coccoides]
MKQAPEDHSQHLQAFEQWLSESRIQARPGMLSRIRNRIAAQDTEFEQRIDSLFAQDPTLGDPQMVAKVRARIEPKQDQEKIIWFQWLTPVAAALVLGIAFFSFQNKAPQAPMPQEAQVVISSPAALSDDPEITRIFALAANLQGASDMSRLQSVDDLAFLFE